MRVGLPYTDGLCLGYWGALATQITPRVYVSQRERQKHLYVLGITGKGKSKFIEGLILQDILASRGCGVIDLHSDLVRNVLSHLVAGDYFSELKRAKRIVYIDINRPELTPPFNLLAVPGDPYAIAQLVIEAFRRTWPDALKTSPQFANIMLAGLLVLIKAKRTLVDLQRLLIDPHWREGVLQAAGDPDATAFFHERYDQWGKQGSLMRESTLNKVSAFAFNPILRQMLGHPENHLDFRAIMDGERVLLCDLGGEPETRRLLGSLLVTFLEHAAFTRRDVPKAKRKPFYLYMDEFQDFSANDGSAKSLSQILSEARKFGLHLTLAHQSLSQLQSRLNGAIGNIQTKVLFGMSRNDAEVFGRGLGKIDTEAVKDAAKTDTQHHLYSSLPEQWESHISGLQWQRPRLAHVLDDWGNVYRMSTMRLPDTQPLPDKMQALFEGIRQRQFVPRPQTTATPLSNADMDTYID